MRNVFSIAFLVFASASLIGWFAVGGSGFFMLSIIWCTMFTITIISEPKSYDDEKFVIHRYGEEFFLEDVYGAIRPSTRKECSRLTQERRIVKTHKIKS